SETPPLPTLLVNAWSRDSGLRYEIRSRTGWTECGASGTFIGRRQSSRKVGGPTRPAGVGHPLCLDQPWKEVVWSGSAGISSGRSSRVPGRLRAPHRPEGADQSSGEAPGDAGRRLRRAAHRHDRARPLSPRLSGARVGAARGLARDAKPDGARREDADAALRGPGPGVPARQAGPDPDPARAPDARRSGEGRGLGGNGEGHRAVEPGRLAQGAGRRAQRCRFGRRHARAHRAAPRKGAIVTKAAKKAMQVEADPPLKLKHTTLSCMGELDRDAIRAIRDRMMRLLDQGCVWLGLDLSAG